MASGLNGQSFAFNGYLPPMPPRQQTHQGLEPARARKADPVVHRDALPPCAMLEALVANCQGGTLICVATDISLPSETIRTMTGAQWKSQLSAGKAPDFTRSRLCSCCWASKGLSTGHDSVSILGDNRNSSRVLIGRSYYVYMLASSSYGTLYIGVTSISSSGSGSTRKNASGFSKQYAVKKLVWFEVHNEVYAALTREKQLKKWRAANGRSRSYSEITDVARPLPAILQYVYPGEGGNPCTA